MKLSEWELWYNEILEDFNFDRKDDENSANLLNIILDEEGCLTIEDLKEQCVDIVTTSNKFIIFGAGPSLKENIKKIKVGYNLNEYILISADGATTALIEEHIIPDIIVTDLDGKLNDILAANYRGAFMVIHAHGNNMEQIDNYVPFFNRILGTTQSVPFGNLYNFGGFTDGDRAMFLALALGAETLILAGMDFGNIVTKYSRPNNDEFLEPADEIKTKKLNYAKDLTNWIQHNENIEIINLSGK